MLGPQIEALKLLRALLENDPGRTLSVNSLDVCQRNFHEIAQISFIELEIAKLRASKTTCTFRSLYYRSISLDYKLFRDCRQLQFVIQKNFFYDDLPVFATSKGLVYGKGSLEVGDTVIDLAEHTNGYLISPQLSRLTEFVSPARVVVIVEKDTVFQELLNAADEHVLLVTAKGYPDYVTINFVNRILKHKVVPVQYLGDLDVHGVAIFLDYRKKLRGEITWMGLCLSDIKDIVNRERAGMPISSRDITLGKRLLSSLTEGDGLLAEILEFILDSKKKFEIEILFTVSSNYLQRWFRTKIGI